MLTVVVRHLFDENQRASPGDLSILKVCVARSRTMNSKAHCMKSMMVSNSTLAAICVWSGLHRFIYSTQQIGQTIRNYERALLAQQTALLAQQTAVLSRVHKESRSMVQCWKDLDAPKVCRISEYSNIC